MLDVSRLSPSELVYTCNYLTHLVGLVVDNKFCGCCLACPLIDGIDIERTGHSMKWRLLMAVIHVDAGDENSC